VTKEARENMARIAASKYSTRSTASGRRASSIRKSGLIYVKRFERAFGFAPG